MHIDGTTTATVPNASPTAASVGSDLYGLAVQRACETLLGLLEPVRCAMALAAAGPDGTAAAEGSISWERLIAEAYEQRVQLSATGFATYQPNIFYLFLLLSIFILTYFLIF